MYLNLWFFHPPYRAVSCPGCESVYTAVPLVVALRDCATQDALVPYYYCAKCGLSTSKFAHLLSKDTPPDFRGAHVVLGKSPDLPKAHGQTRVLHVEAAPRDGQEMLDVLRLYVARKPAFDPLLLKVHWVNTDEEAARAVLSAADPLAAATALLTRYLSFFS